MKKDMGEFEERPKVQEATPIPLRRRRPIGWMVATFCFAAISLILGAYIIVDKNAESERNKVASDSEEETTTDQDGDWDKKVEELMYGLQTEISPTVLRASEVKREKDLAVVYTKLDSGVFVGLDHSQSLTIPNMSGVNDDIYEDIAKKQVAFDKKIVSVLQNNGLSLDRNVSLFGYGESFYYKSDDGLICQYVSGSNPLSIDCGHKSWLSSETKDLAVKLIEAYKMKLNTLPATLYVKADDIKDGKSGYQSLSVATGNAAGLFYRKSENSDWVFFRTTQQALTCSQYNTQDLLKAFAGETCLDDATGNAKKVGE